MNPLTEYRWCLSLIRKLFRIISLDIFRSNYRNGFGFYVILMLWIFVDFCYVATILDDKNYDVTTRFSCASLCFGVIQITIRYYILPDLQHLLRVTEFIADIYAKNSEPKSQYYRVCAQFARISKLTTQIGLAVYVVTIAVITLSGSIESLIKGDYRPTLYIYLPHVGAYSTGMTVLSFIFNHVMAVACIFAIPPGELLFFIIFANMPMIPVIVRGQFERLTEVLRAKELNVIDVKRRIVQYIRMQLKYNDNVLCLDKCFFKFCILQFITANGYSAFGTFVVIKAGLPMAYAIVAVGLFQITAYCVLGTIVENSSNQIYEAVCAFNWYKLPRNELQNYHLLLHYAQQPQRLYIAGVKPLNMEACVSSLKGIYTYAMLLNSIA